MAAYPNIKTTAQNKVLIIHHVANIWNSEKHFYEQPLKEYREYLKNIPAQQRPQLILISGNVTLTGSKDELSNVYTELSIIKNMLDEIDDERKIVITPGLHDLEWRLSDKKDVLKAFKDQFSDFILPDLPDENGGVLKSLRPFAVSDRFGYFVFPVNTIQKPGALRQGSRPQKELLRQFQDAWKKIAAQSAAGGYSSGQVKEFMQTLQQFIWSETSYVDVREAENLQQTVAKELYPDDAADTGAPNFTNYYKILVTHHPILPFTVLSERSFSAAANSFGLLNELSSSEFQLLAHGYARGSSLLTQFPIAKVYNKDDNTGDTSTITQSSAGSLGSAGLASDYERSFNEIVATYNPESKGWSTYARRIFIRPNEKDTSLFQVAIHPAKKSVETVLLNKPEIASFFTEADMVVLQRHKDVLQNVGEAFTRAISDLHQQIGDVPSQALSAVGSIISSTIFQPGTTRVGLALKKPFSLMNRTRHISRSVCVIENTYIDPVDKLDPSYIHPFTYPDTLGAWSLILGKVIVFPLKDPNEVIDYQWLEQNNKIQVIEKALQYLSNGDDPAAFRARDLLEKFNHQTLKLSDTFLPPPENTVPSRYTSFISVPVPLRPTAAVPAIIPEMGILTIDVIDAPNIKPGSAFTEDRILLLKFISQVINMILQLGNAAKRPVGTWEEANNKLRNI